MSFWKRKKGGNSDQVGVTLLLEGKPISNQDVKCIANVQNRISNNEVQKKRFLNLLKKYCVLVEDQEDTLEFPSKESFRKFLEECKKLLKN